MGFDWLIITWFEHLRSTSSQRSDPATHGLYLFSDLQGILHLYPSGVNIPNYIAFVTRVNIYQRVVAFEFVYECSHTR
jgi:hypothetical protein